MPIAIVAALKILGNKWLWIGVAIAAAVAFVSWQRHEITSISAERDRAVSDRQVAEAANAELSTALARARKAAAASDAAITHASQRITAANKRVADLARKIDALNDQTKCGPAVATVLDSLRNKAGGDDHKQLP